MTDNDNNHSPSDEMMDSKPAAVDRPSDLPVDDEQDDNLGDLEEQQLPEDNIDNDNNMTELQQQPEELGEEEEVVAEQPPNVDFVEDPAEEDADGKAGGDKGEITVDVEQPAEVFAPPTNAPTLKDPPPDSSMEGMMKSAPDFDESPKEEGMPKLKDPPPPPPDDSTEGMVKDDGAPKLKDPPPPPPEMTDITSEGNPFSASDSPVMETAVPKLKDPPPPPPDNMEDNSTEGMMEPYADATAEEPTLPKLKDPPPPVADSTEGMMKPAPVASESDEPALPKLMDPPPPPPVPADDSTEGMVKPVPVSGPEDEGMTKPAPDLDVIAMQEAMLAGKPEADSIPASAHSQGDMNPAPLSDAAAKEEAMMGRKPETASMPGAVHSQPENDHSSKIATKENDGKEDQLPTKNDGGGNPEELKNQKKTASKREINPDFEDLQKTGKWGSISKIEMIGVGVVAVLIVIIVAVVLGVVLSRDNTTVETVPPATAAPTPMATPVPPEEKMPILLEALENNNMTSTLFANETLPDIPYFYSGKLDAGDCDEVPHQCAMSWSLFEDEFPPATNNVVHRFAMAAFYYSMGGDNWVNNTNWLTDSSYCDWHGIKCNRGATMIEEIMLDENNLDGRVPLALALVDTFAVVSLKGNEIGGTLPGGVFAGMPELFLLLLQDNMFTGPIPSNLHDNGNLAILFIQENNFTGPYPSNYCTGGPRADEPIFREFGVDCDTNPCPAGCCFANNCY